MQRDKIWDYEVQLDKAATAGWYEKSGGWGCECRHCQNFLALVRQKQLPIAVLDLLSNLNILPEKPTYMIKELLFEGSNRYFDQALCTGLTITNEDIDALCKAMKERAVKNAYNEEQKASIKDVGRQQLRSWGVLIERDGKDYPSNDFAILTGCGGLHVTTQCGVFKGTTKEVFVDRREYTGPLWEQIDEAFQFVLRNIHLGAAIVGIYRQDVYEIPPDAIRELLINAMVHRSIWIMVRYKLRCMIIDWKSHLQESCQWGKPWSV